MRHGWLIAVMVLGMWSGTAAAQEQAAQEQPAQDTTPTGVLRIGKLYSFGGGAALDHGFGMDLRYQVFPERQLEAFVGTFAQGQYELGDAWRFAGGITGGFGIFGLELGISHRTSTADYAGSTGLHVGQSFTLGPVSLGARLTIPLVDHVPSNVAPPLGVQGIEGAVTLSMSFGFTVHGQRRTSARSCHPHGHGSH
jgi:hypothetical protein